jgi:hypothetical protein
MQCKIEVQRIISTGYEGVDGDAAFSLAKERYSIN